jgi:hypothetical protein
MTIAKSPVLLLIFNRPDTTMKVLESIRQYAPEKLYIACDGPRLDLGDEENVQIKKLQQAVIKGVNWPCSVRTLFRTENLGCQHAVTQAIDWFFTHENQGIILEDDCVPCPDFYPYCSLLLDKYKAEPKIYHISGDNFINTQGNSNQYFFTRYTHGWGWATWKRAWQEFHLDFPGLPEFISQQGLAKLFPDTEMQQFWIRKFQQVQAGEIIAWDYQWTYTIFRKQGLSIQPGVNLVTNIGFGQGAVNMKGTRHPLGFLPTGTLDINTLSGPSVLEPNIQHENKEFRVAFRPPLWTRIKQKLNL